MDQAARLSASEVETARERRLAAMRLQEIEGNPLSADDVAMFEMFEREAWDPRAPPGLHSGPCGPVGG